MLQDKPPGMDASMSPMLLAGEDGILTPEQYNDTLECVFPSSLNR